MKNQIKLATLIFGLIFTVTACKDNKKTEEQTTKIETKQEQPTYNGTKTIDVANSNIIWKGHKIIGNHTGDIQLKEGQLNFENGTLKGGSFIVDMSTIRATELMDDDEEEEEEEEGEDDKSDLANHLKDGDFFDVKTFPEAKFVITNVDKLSTSYMVKGHMTIKDKTNEIEFPARIVDNHFKANVTIDRTQFGIKYGSGSFFDNLGDNVIKDKFDLEIDLKIIE